MLHIRPNARTTAAVRADIARSTEPSDALARRYDVRAETIRKWRKRGAAVSGASLTLWRQDSDGCCGGGMDVLLRCRPTLTLVPTLNRNWRHRCGVMTHEKPSLAIWAASRAATVSVWALRKWSGPRSW